MEFFLCEIETDFLHVIQINLTLQGRAIAGLSTSKSRFDPRSVYMRFVVEKVALGQVFLQVLQFSLLVSFHQGSILIHSSTTNAV
jgi:hypothetical protein